MKKICVVTSTRAEYGLISPVLKLIQNQADLVLQLVVSGTHLLERFGRTEREITADGHQIDGRVEMLLAGDSGVAAAKSIGLAVTGYADQFSRLNPDLLLIVGARFEALAAAECALLMSIPIVHLHGGEVTEGAMDDSIRHAISKMSSLHCVSTDTYKERLVRMGEPEDRIFVTGAPGIDNIVNEDLSDLTELRQLLEWDIRDRFFLITYHPVTRMHLKDENSMASLFAALARFHDHDIIVTYPNADPGHTSIVNQIRQYQSENGERVRVFDSLGRKRYLSAAKLAELVIGNSSSGIIEVPSLGTPTINIGNRQTGRVMGASVITCDNSIDGIAGSIEQGMSPRFQQSIEGKQNPYGDGKASERIVDLLSSLDLNNIRIKKFNDP